MHEVAQREHVERGLAGDGACLDDVRDHEDREQALDEERRHDAEGAEQDGATVLRHEDRDGETGVHLAALAGGPELRALRAHREPLREGRVLVAGDAAHLMPVWMGQGWNSGMRDATNLSWKLASVLSGQADEGILDSYKSERRDHAKAMIDLSMTLGNVIKLTNRLVCGARDVASRVLNLSPQVKDYFADMKFKPMPFYAEGVVVEPDTLRPGRQERTRRSRFMTVRNAVSKVTPVGTQFIQPRVRTADVHEARLDDVVGPWWTVAAWGNDPARLFTPQEREQLRHMGAQLVCFTSESQRAWAQDDLADPETLVVGCVDGALKSWFDTRAMGVVFLRPDRFVAAACLAQEAGTALASLRTAMHATPVASGAALDPAEVAGDVTDAGAATPSLEVVA